MGMLGVMVMLKLTTLHYRHEYLWGEFELYFTLEHATVYFELDWNFRNWEFDFGFPLSDETLNLSF
jgi:hypothetical protein